MCVWQVLPASADILVVLASLGMPQELDMAAMPSRAMRFHTRFHIYIIIEHNNIEYNI